MRDERTCLSRAAGALTLFVTTCLTATAAQAAPCDADDVARVLVQDQGTATLSCSGDLTLPANAYVTRQIRIYGAGATGLRLHCNGATIDGRPRGTAIDMIEVRSRQITQPDGSAGWERPTDVEVDGCSVHGAVRVWGMARNGEGVHLRDSSGLPGHVWRARSAAPSDITLSNLTIHAFGRTPLYVAPGSSYVTLRDSTLRGHAVSVAVYLDTETHHNAILDNDIQVSTGSRELIAIDASERNRVFGNYLAGLGNGGIFLYRNCGEGGTIRYTTPSHNEIINNVFYYTPGSGARAAVLVGSRNGNRNYCGHDAARHPGVTEGSAGSNLDFAQHNVIMQNQLYHLDPSDMIRFGRSTDQPWYVAHNESVAAPVSRPTGCYVPRGFTKFIEDGERTDAILAFGSFPYGVQYRCEDGVLITEGYFAPERVDFECQVTGNNSGCTRVVHCPAGTTSVGARVACNLEWGRVSDTEWNGVAPGEMSVVRASSRVSDGTCFAGATSASEGVQRVFANPSTAIFAHCREHDSNGGDCHIRGELYCH